MITSNINEILLKSQIENQKNTQNTDNKFLSTLMDTKEKQTEKLDLTYESIKNTTLSQINDLYGSNEEKSMAKNLKLATMFSTDENLSKALFNTVLGKPFDLGYTYLFNMYEDKSNYFNFSKNNSLSALLEQTVKKNYGESEIKAGEQIPKDKLDEILTTINSYNFITTLTNGYKNLDDKYKDKDDKYSFLYNDFYLQYQELEYKYDKIKKENNSIINQF